MANPHFAEIERREQGRVPGKNSQLALAARSDDHLGVSLEDSLLRRYDGHVQHLTL
jgi:hypothetical protein